MGTVHSTRAASNATGTALNTVITSINENTNSTSTNNDMVFIPPKTPVRSKTKEPPQYHTPSKLITKSGIFKKKLINIRLMLISLFLRFNES